MKYIVIRHEWKGVVRELPVIFPEAMVHADVFRCARHMLGLDAGIITCAAAGFVSSVEVGTTVDDSPIRCHGESESLNVPSRLSKDAELIGYIDYSHGILGGDIAGMLKRVKS